MIVSCTQRRKRAVFYLYDTIWLPYFYLPHKYTIRTKGIQITLYFIMSSVSLAEFCCFYENMVCINSTVNVKQKQI